MKARAALSAVVSLVLAFAPAAQAAVVEGRIQLGGATSVPALRLTVGTLTGAPTLTGSSFFAPSLGFTALIAPSPLPAAAIVAAHPVVGVVAQPIALARTLPAASKDRPRDPQQRAHDAQERLHELKHAFDEKSPEDTPANAIDSKSNGGQLRPDAHDHAPLPNEPPPPPHDRRTILGFSRPLVFFLLALVIAQVGVEAQNAGLPPLIAKVFGNVSVAADVGMTASLAELVGTIAAPIVAKKLGLKGAYMWSTGLRVVTGGLIAGLLAASWLSMTGSWPSTPSCSESASSRRRASPPSSSTRIKASSRSSRPPARPPSRP